VLRYLCSGPGRLSQAFGVTGALDGQPLDQTRFFILRHETEAPVVIGPRIGITRGTETLWRFGLSGSPFLSKRFVDEPSARRAKRKVSPS
jgi:DNA-3-methyladenine glycosylase